MTANEPKFTSAAPSYFTVYSSGDSKFSGEVTANRFIGDGSSLTGVTTAGYFACDRFYYYVDSIGTWTVSQDTDAPDGFGNSLKISCTTADASPAVGDRAILQHRIEGQFLQHLAKGTTSAKKVTLSFMFFKNVIFERTFKSSYSSAFSN